MRRVGRMVLAGLLIAGCGFGDSPRDSTFVASVGDLPLTIETPTTIVGLLDVSVEEGDVGSDGISEVNFGSVEVEGGYVLVDIPGDVVRAAGLSWDDLQRIARYEVSVSGPSEFVDEQIPSYLVDALTPLD